MFLRSLYGSRMPQARHPRADEQVSNYWRDDTESAREMARMMDELEASDSGNDGDGTAMKKPALPAVMAEDATTSSSRGRGNSLLNRALLAHVNAVAPLDTLDSLNVDDVNAATAMLQAQLSPTGLISIAAADIDDAARAGTESLSVHTELDLEMLHSIRRAGATTDAAPPRPVLMENFLERLLASSPNPIALSSSPPSSSSSQRLSEEESPLRFLSLLRRINELRSQQVQQDADVWDGLPYPQILALPTFKYTMRERAVMQQCDDDHNDNDGHINNTMCAVCYTEYEQDEEVRALPCLHFYHRECIDQWLLHHRMCPICKHIVAVY